MKLTILDLSKKVKEMDKKPVQKKYPFLNTDGEPMKMVIKALCRTEKIMIDVT